jgi:hypothetical protein
LNDSMGGPSSDLTPDFTRRTIYGKVSRYKLDEYLMLFDFPSPNLSAEKRFSTTVPLQRLFLMNSDFMQMQSESLAVRVAGEADNSARIRKLYRIVYNREATGDEVKLGLDYLHSEPMKEFEAAKTKSEEKKPDDKKAEAKSDDKPEDGSDEDMGAAMITGVPGFGKRGKNPAPEYFPTPLGRYAKILLSSSEFVFIN